MTERPYETTTIAELYQEQEDAKSAAKMVKETQAAIQEELRARFAGYVEVALNGDSGTHKRPVVGYVVKAVADKEVEWDSEALLTQALGMERYIASQIFDITVKVKERVYANLTGHLRESAEAARTVTIKSPKFTIEKKESK